MCLSRPDLSSELQTRKSVQHRHLYLCCFHIKKAARRFWTAKWHDLTYLKRRALAALWRIDCGKRKMSEEVLGITRQEVMYALEPDGFGGCGEKVWDSRYVLKVGLPWYVDGLGEFLRERKVKDNIKIFDLRNWNMEFLFTDRGRLQREQVKGRKSGCRKCWIWGLLTSKQTW